ncbi:hypothetical protein N866_00755 [Actinotalea ferrariae CF5-4]|uniref:HNH nuclease domain-containing protein n=1 Tax=Actinotalea ferrariae CF5-4 TaxID=948458 RepID=A0A021VQN2_9CELL|nr:HNH endonuclease signature motif containing protein [Actinotalea ferrariae]EYR63433.1 hypothetical protein N866_00755 [Actinotalea ferrariae CF5-4]
MFDDAAEWTAQDEDAAALAFARSRAGRSIPDVDLAVRWALNHPHAARVAAAVPGPELARMLGRVAVADAPTEDLLEVVAAWDRLASWVVARQAGVLQELHRRVAGSTWAQKGLRDEVAGTLAASGRAAQVLLDRAMELAQAPEVHDALAQGAVSVHKADVLLRETGSVTGEEARRVHAAVLAEAHELTAPQVRAAARQAVLQVDPDAAEHRHQLARRDRCVVLEPATDCMAVIRAYLPAEDAVRVMHAVDIVAGTAAPEDPRGVDARRADALVDLVGAVLDGTTLDAFLSGPLRPSVGAGVDAGVGLDVGARSSRRRRRRPVKLSITVSADALAGASSTPAHLDRYGPVLPSVARQLAAEATWHFQRTDPTTGEALEQPGSRYRPPEALRDAIVARDVTCTFPGCRVPAGSCDLDHTVPFDDSRDAAEQTRRSNLAALCRHHHQLKTHAGWTPRRDPTTGTTLWTSPTGKPYHRNPVPAPGEAVRAQPERRRPAPRRPAEPPGTVNTGDPPF